MRLSPLRLQYNQPARNWMTEALPLGNGFLGAMCFGDTKVERLQFNVNSLWTGCADETGAYQAFGDIFIELDHINSKDYRRELDIRTAIHRVSYEHNSIHFEWESFASHPAKVLVVRMTADKKAAYSGRIWLTDMHGAAITAGEKCLMSSGQLEQEGLLYEAQLLVLNENGKVTVQQNPVPPNSSALHLREEQSIAFPEVSLLFEECDSLTLIFSADTNYSPDASRNFRTDSPHNEIKRRIHTASNQNIEHLMADHVADYQSLFNRLEINLGVSGHGISDEPTDRRLLSYTNDARVDPELEALFFQYGRYLLISCSRPGNLPANLQGLWNDSNNPPWRCDYHSNINVQMNYWPVEVANLSECHIPFFDYVLSQAPIARMHTYNHYGSNVRGWTTRTENGVFGGSSFVWNITANAWYAQNFWEHYLFSQDQTYLVEVAYPLLKEICEFWEDTLKRRHDGILVVPNGWSPEHGPYEDGTTYDQEIVYDLFTNYIEAATVLGIDIAYKEKISEMRDHLLMPQIGKWGQLQEWEVDRDDPMDDHRHVSHLFALYPGKQISPLSTPELAEAAQISLKARGDGGTGWSRAWKICFWARFLDGNHAYNMLRNLLTFVDVSAMDYTSKGGGVYLNLLDAHPPFQIDGNFGATAGIAEMLLQSHSNTIHLLPALPAAWLNGRISGLRARGGFEVDIEWRDGRLVQAIICNLSGKKSSVRYVGKIREISIGQGEKIRLDGSLSPV